MRKLFNNLASRVIWQSGSAIENSLRTTQSLCSSTSRAFPTCIKGISKWTKPPSSKDWLVVSLSFCVLKLFFNTFRVTTMPWSKMMRAKSSSFVNIRLCSRHIAQWRSPILGPFIRSLTELPTMSMLQTKCCQRYSPRSSKAATARAASFNPINSSWSNKWKGNGIRKED